MILSIGVIVFAKKGAIQNLTHSSQYSWQQTCDSECAVIVGTKDMADIDAAGCGELKLSKGIMEEMLKNHQSGAPDYWHPKEHLLALNDKIISIPCQ